MEDEQGSTENIEENGRHNGKTKWMERKEWKYVGKEIAGESRNHASRCGVSPGVVGAPT